MRNSLPLHYPLLIHDTATLTTNRIFNFIIILICNHYGFMLTIYVGTYVTVDTNERSSKMMEKKSIYIISSQFHVMEKFSKLQVRLVCVPDSICL